MTTNMEEEESHHNGNSTSTSSINAETHGMLNQLPQQQPLPMLPASSKAEPIHIYLIDGQPYIWTTEEQEILRRDYHIICYPTGTLPGHTTQNMFHGIPYLIDKEACRMLLDHGRANLWRIPHPSELPQAEAAARQKTRHQSIFQQLYFYLYGKDPLSAEHQRAGESDADESELVCKRAKVSSHGSDSNGPTRERAPPSVSTVSVEPAAEAPSRIIPWTLSPGDLFKWLKFPWTERGKALEANNIDLVKQMSPNALTPPPSPKTVSATTDSALAAVDSRGSNDSVQASYHSSEMAGINGKREDVPDPPLHSNTRRLAGQKLDICRIIVPHTPKRIQRLRRPLPPRAFKFPLGRAEQCRAAVYSDLVMRGYFVTPGLKFGGDFLVYSGDPYRFHSHFVAIVMEHDGDIHPLDLVAIGRLATVVKKVPLVCSVDADDRIHYLSVSWTGVN